MIQETGGLLASVDANPSLKSENGFLYTTHVNEWDLWNGIARNICNDFTDTSDMDRFVVLAIPMEYIEKSDLKTSEGVAILWDIFTTRIHLGDEMIPLEVIKCLGIHHVDFKKWDLDKSWEYWSQSVGKDKNDLTIHFPGINWIESCHFNERISVFREIYGFTYDNADKKGKRYLRKRGFNNRNTNGWIKQAA